MDKRNEVSSMNYHEIAVHQNAREEERELNLQKINEVKETANLNEVKRLKPFLPSARKIEEMNDSDFSEWISVVELEIPERKKARDPLSHLRKQISQILNDDSKTEIEKEEAVEKSIRSYRKFLSQQFLLKKST